ncbi:amidase [Sagittula sp. MA-2]|jgi:aspartyl-tRNA(Asn)/glutamyl-tRNA(Gln) amidotransferase subunit A|uniref:amidase n=1 Tax=Sagittula sp. MA-2 TaxID=3048007 RepID=UPI0024C3079E|nr:amidase [Sagittula sp. MA-2]WHZ33567.1 amidase [Sagittula sp. MA-2]
MIDAPIRAQAAAVADGTVKASDLAQATRDRIAARDAVLRSVVHLADPTALDGPLHGVPFGVKDIIDVAGQPTRCGSHAHGVTGPEATAVTRLRAAGMVPMAKLATYEYALTGPAWDQPNLPARNPWNPEHITGGSSSGSAAAVAGGLFRVALGTDTGGSIRAPAAYCGVVGLKPTHGVVPDDGCFPLSPSLDVIGPLAATVEDAAVTLEVMAPDTRAAQALGQGIDGLHIGYARDWFAEDPACVPEVLRAMDDTAALLSRLGARIELVSLPDYPQLEAAGTVILQYEAWQVHRSRLAEHWDRYGVDARRNLVTGAVLTEDHVARARALAVAFRAAVDTHLARHAALLTPTTLSPAPRFSDFEDGPVWTAMRTLPFNMSGHPAISVPCGFADNGLPLGAQFVSAHGQEALLCRIAAAFERGCAATACRAMPADPVVVGT